MFGFGDATTGDQSVFSFQPDGRPCDGLNEVLERYDVLTPQLALGGPTNFAPIIYEAIRRVKVTNSYHILVIIAGAQSCPCISVNYCIERNDMTDCRLHICAVLQMDR